MEKTAIVQFLKKVMEKYGYNALPSTLSEDMKSGAAHHLANMKRKRGIFLEEPKNGLISSATFKAITGSS